ncbi:MAG: E3 binding domain-containing protein [Rubrobacter sp.]|nr:E3 binding domain-containing protein [Rubrobacter sp.]
MSEGQREGSKRSATERADELLDRAGWTAGFFASMIGRRLAKIAAFAREEAEDLWAEAQNMRQSDEGLSRTARGTAEQQKAESDLQEADGEARTSTDTAGVPPKTEEREPEAEQGVEPDEEAEPIKATAAARRHAEELSVDLREVEGTGSGGQITAGDVKKKAGAES